MVKKQEYWKKRKNGRCVFCKEKALKNINCCEKHRQEKVIWNRNWRERHPNYMKEWNKKHPDYMVEYGRRENK